MGSDKILKHNFTGEWSRIILTNIFTDALKAIADAEYADLTILQAYLASNDKAIRKGSIFYDKEWSQILR